MKELSISQMEQINGGQEPLADCVNAGIWGVGTILTSATPIGWLSAGVAVTYLIDCLS